MSYKLFLYLSLAAFSTASQAKHALPVFSGKWYTKVEYSYLDACSKIHFNYDNLVDSPTENIVENIIKNKNPRSDCRWTSPQMSTTIHAHIWTIDFPGNEEDWRQFLDNSSYKDEQFWSSECKDKNKKTIDWADVVFHPKYECPKGSRFASKNSKIGDESDSYGCSTTPGTCISDVVGRDLNVVGLGAVGMLV